jgi:hypothetical protein
MYCKVQYTKLRHDEMEFFCLSRPNLPRYHHIADKYRNREASSVPNFCICCCLSFVYGVFLLIRRCGYLKKQQVLFYLYFFCYFFKDPCCCFLVKYYISKIHEGQATFTGSCATEACNFG